MSEYEALLKSIERYLKKADDELTDTLKGEGYTEPETTVKAINDAQDALSEAFDDQKDSLIANVEGLSVTDALDMLDETASADVSDIPIRELFEREFTSLMTEITEAYIKNTDKALSFSNFTRRTTDWISSWSQQLGEIMKLSTHDGLQKILSDALVNGDSIQTVVTQLEDWYGFSPKRARATAVTEMLTAHSAAAQEAYVQSPAVGQKMWRHTGAHKNEPRLNHVAIDGQTVAVGDKFTLKGEDGNTYDPEFPRDTRLPPGERVHCHCISQPVVDKDVLGLSLEERQALQRKAVDDDDGAWETELDARNKAAAGINEDTVTLDWYEQKTKEEKVKYLGGKRKWALTEAGLVKTDAELSNIKSKSLKQLSDDGIITIKPSVIVHSTRGEFTGLGNPNLPPSLKNGGRMKNGGHSQKNLDELTARGWEYNIEKTYGNGVRVGNVPTHKDDYRQTGANQSWFPEEWTDDDVLVAGTYVVNQRTDVKDLLLDGEKCGYIIFGEYSGIRVGVMTDLDYQPGTVFPDKNQ